MQKMSRHEHHRIDGKCDIETIQDDKWKNTTKEVNHGE